MKVNKKYVHAAVVHTAIDRGSIKELANQVVEHIGGDVELFNTKVNGFTLRQMKSAEVGNDLLTEAITSAVCDILDEDLEDNMDYILENYDFVYNADAIDADHIRELFDYSHDGRLIYVEIDM